MVGFSTYHFLKSSAFVRSEEGKALDSTGLEKREREEMHAAVIRQYFWYYY
jgi:hypothetical protein